MDRSIALVADKIFTGDTWLTEQAVLVEGNSIKSILPAASVPGGIEKKQYPGCMLVPSFIDLQIYGAHGKLFAVYPEADALSRLRDYCRAGGAAYCLPTVATNPLAVFHQCIDAIREYWDKGGQSVLGLHIEGPWINAAKKGAHIEAYIHSPSMQEVKDLLDYGKDVIKMITLAPEICSREVIEYILSKGIVVSAGHSNASYAQANQGFSYGIPVATHLFNAMSSLQHRAPGLVGAVLDHRKVMASIIPDGHHVDFAVIRIAKQVMKERLFVITDAVTETPAGDYPHVLSGDKYEAGGILSGSALTMSKAVSKLVQEVQIDLPEALRMCSLYPARVMNLHHTLGKIEPGYTAAMTVLDGEFAVRDIFCYGK